MLRRRTAGRAALAGLAALIAYLALWPVAIDPVAWRAPAPPEDPAFAPNDRFRGLARLAAADVRGPEAVALDPQGRVVTGTEDGRVVRIDPATGAVEELARTGGRPLGLALDREGGLWICDGAKGLLHLDAARTLRVVATSHGGLPFGLADDVDVGPDGTVYFSDASSKFGLHQDREDILEHGGHGRLLAYHPATGRTELLLGGLEFANGVAVSGDGSYLLVTETGAYRIRRYWLAGPRRGTSDLFAENLPGLPDNITWSAERQAFWVALFSPRVPALDLLAPHPFLRQVVLRIPRALQPQPAAQGFALALGEDGRVREALRDAGAGAYAPVTSVRERGGVLFVGSLSSAGVGRLPAPPLPQPAAPAGLAAPGAGKR